jgi:hypothetical protein
MKRTNISLTDEQYDWLKKRAWMESKSMSGVIRGMCDDGDSADKILEDVTKPPEKKCVCIYVDGKLTEPCAHHSLEGIDPTEKKPQDSNLTDLDKKAKEQIENFEPIVRSAFKSCKHGAKVGLCKKGCK